MMTVALSLSHDLKQKDTLNLFQFSATFFVRHPVVLNVYLIVCQELDMTIVTKREVMCAPTIIWEDIGQQPGYFNKSLSCLNRETFEYKIGLMSPSVP